MKEFLKRKKLDIIVISAITTVAVVSLLFIFLFKEAGSVCVVEVDGKTVGEYSLMLDGEFVLNGGTNTLVISGGEAYMINSHCPDHTCENTGRIKYVGQTIICLPNKLSVTVRGETPGGVDLVS